jgi:hypothetical protein
VRCSDAVRVEALRLAADVGAAEAARQLGLKANTMRCWLSCAGRTPTTEAVAQTATATAAKRTMIAAKKAALADAALRMAGELCCHRRAQGDGCGGDARGSRSSTSSVSTSGVQPSKRDKRLMIVNLGLVSLPSMSLAVYVVLVSVLVSVARPFRALVGIDANRVTPLTRSNAAKAVWSWGESNPGESGILFGKRVRLDDGGTPRTCPKIVSEQG